MQSVFIDSALGFAIGLSLGLLGGGGSILTVPALVYIVGQSPHAAMAVSLVIVGANSAMGAMFHRAQGTINWHVALLFGGAGVIAAYLAGGLSNLLPPTVMMILFALLMLVIGALMIFRSVPDECGEFKGLAVTIASGIGVGVLTGFLGVGGGFLIVPALVMIVGLPMRQAVGTSLVVIAMNSIAGLMGRLNGFSLDTTIVLIFVAAGLAGTFAGARLARQIEPARLRQIFALFVIGLAFYLLFDNLGKLVI